MLLYCGGIVAKPAKTSMPCTSDGVGSTVLRSGIASGNVTPSIITRYQQGTDVPPPDPSLRCTTRCSRLDIANTPGAPLPYCITRIDGTFVSICQVSTGLRFSMSSAVMLTVVCRSDRRDS